MSFLVLLVLSGVLVEGVVVRSFAVLGISLLFSFMSRMFSLLMEVLGMLGLISIAVFARGVFMTRMADWACNQRGNE